MKSFYFLKHYGASLQNVVKENLVTTDTEAVKAANDIGKAYYKGDFLLLPGRR